MADQADRDGKLTEEETVILEKARKPIIIANRFRILFLALSLIFLVIIYFKDQSGIESAQTMMWLYLALLFSILLMLFCILIKIGCAVRYNHILKKM